MKVDARMLFGGGKSTNLLLFNTLLEAIDI